MALLAAGRPAIGNGVIEYSDLLGKIQYGVTTSQQVTEILGRPGRISQFARAVAVSHTQSGKQREAA